MIIDTHFHAFPGKYLERVPEQSANDPRGVGFHAFDHREYLDVMDRYGVDLGVLSNTGGRIEQAKHPRRFKAFARLPMIDMDDALREMERCYGDLGMHGVMLPTNLAGHYLDETVYEPFWQAVAAAGKPLFLHPANAPCQANWGRYSLHQKILWPTDTTLAVSRIVYSGVFDRHPGLKLIAAHLGGMILIYPDRLNWREGNVRCKLEPEAYFKKIYFDTAGPIRASFIKLACETVGPEQILFGSDYPHGRNARDDEFFPMTLKAMDDLDIAPEDKEKIFYRNAKRLFGFAEG
jgi:uncharacterized protein